MLLGGLWHGANWTFVIWGAFHGGLLSISHAIQDRYFRVAAAISRATKFAGILLTFYLVNIGWVLFRARTLRRAISVLGDLHAGRLGPVSGTALVTLAMVLTILGLSHGLSALEVSGEQASILRRPTALWAVVVGCFALSMAIGGVGQAFIYFQF
jgi:D-alanyl-lipoteichoic acid acyltransferase DltB (MBOAT superfamily)